MNRKVKFIGLGALILAATVTCIVGLNLLMVFAYTGYSTLTEEELYNATNTYNISEECFEDGAFKVDDDDKRVTNQKQYHLKYNLN